MFYGATYLSLVNQITRDIRHCFDADQYWWFDKSQYGGSIEWLRKLTKEIWNYFRWLTGLSDFDNNCNSGLKLSDSAT